MKTRSETRKPGVKTKPSSLRKCETVHENILMNRKIPILVLERLKETHVTFHSAEDVNQENPEDTENYCSPENVDPLTIEELPIKEEPLLEKYEVSIEKKVDVKEEESDYQISNGSGGILVDLVIDCKQDRKGFTLGSSATDGGHRDVPDSQECDSFILPELDSKADLTATFKTSSGYRFLHSEVLHKKTDSSKVSYTEENIHDQTIIKEPTISSNQNKQSVKRHFCIYCKTKFTKIKRHLLAKHKSEKVIAQYLSLKRANPEDRKNVRDDVICNLVKKGDYIYNQSLLADPNKKECLVTELLTVNRVALNKLNGKISDYLVCKFCLGVYKKQSFRAHLKCCTSKKKFKNNGVLESYIDTLREVSATVSGGKPKKDTSSVKNHGITSQHARFSKQVLLDAENTVLEYLTTEFEDSVVVAVSISVFQGSDKAKIASCKGLKDGIILLRKIREKDPKISTLSDCFSIDKLYLIFHGVKEMCEQFDKECCHLVLVKVLSWFFTVAGAEVIKEVRTKFVNDEVKNAKIRDINVFLGAIESNWKSISLVKEKTCRSKPVKKARSCECVYFLDLISSFDNLTSGIFLNNAEMNGRGIEKCITSDVAANVAKKDSQGAILNHGSAENQDILSHSEMLEKIMSAKDCSNPLRNAADIAFHEANSLTAGSVVPNETAVDKTPLGNKVRTIISSNESEGQSETKFSLTNQTEKVRDNSSSQYRKNQIENTELGEVELVDKKRDSENDLCEEIKSIKSSNHNSGEPKNESVNLVCPVDSFSSEKPDHQGHTKQFPKHMFTTSVKSDTLRKSCKQIQLTKKKVIVQKNYCLFCNKLVPKFNQHVLRKHKDKEMVIQYMTLAKESSFDSKIKRKKIMQLLQLKSIAAYNRKHAQNVTIIKKPTANTYPRYFKCNKFKERINEALIESGENLKDNKNVGTSNCDTPEKYVAHKNVNNKIKKIPFWKEYGIQIQCQQNPLTENPLTQASTRLRELILPRLTNTEIAKFAVNDALLVATASSLLERSINKSKDNDCTTHKHGQVANFIYDSGKLLKCAQSLDKTITEFRDLLKPSKISTMFEASKEICGLDERTGNIKLTAMPFRITYVINQAAAQVVEEVLTDTTLSDSERKLIKSDIDEFLNLKREKFRSIITHWPAQYKARKHSISCESNQDVSDENLTVVSETERNSVTGMSLEKYSSFSGNNDAIKRKKYSISESEENSHDEDYIYNLEDEKYGNQSCSAQKRRWSEKQKRIVILHFKEFIQKGTNPGRKRCRELIANTEELMDRTADQVNLLIDNINKGKLRIPPEFAYLKSQHDKSDQRLIECGEEIFNLKSSEFRSIEDFWPASKKTRSLMSSESYQKFNDGSLTVVSSKTETSSVTEVILKKYSCVSSNMHVIKRKNHSISNSERSSCDESEDYLVTLKDGKQKKQCCRQTEITERCTPVRKTCSSSEKKKWSDKEKSIVILHFKEFIKNGRNPGRKKCRELIANTEELRDRTADQVNLLIDNINKGKLKIPPEFTSHTLQYLTSQHAS